MRKLFKRRRIVQITAGVAVVGVGLLVNEFFLGPHLQDLKLASSTFQTNEPVVANIGDVKGRFVRAEVIGRDGKPIDVETTKKRDGNDTILEVSPASMRGLKPGAYQLKVIDTNGTVKQQQFTWGVLAINPNKSTYLPYSTAKLSIAVLDDEGVMVCDASVKLEIVAPDGRKTMLTSKEGRIKVNPACTVKDFVMEPDYESEYQVNGPGEYRMNLSAITPNGERRISDSFEVIQDLPFSVERTTATRVYPAKPNPVRITVKAYQDFKGQVTEVVPGNFEVNKSGPNQTYDSVEKQDDRHILTWNLEMKKGDEKSLSYTYDAPDESPQFYLLGPMTFNEGETIKFQESRTWQLAIDAEVTIDSSTHTNLFSHKSQPTLAFISDQVGYMFYRDGGGTCAYSKTTNGGTSWGVAVNVSTVACAHMAIWWDRWTPGDTTGNYIHVAFMNTAAPDDIYYERIDTANSDTQLGEVIARAETADLGDSDYITITKGSNGALYIANTDTTAGAAGVDVCTASCGTETNWAAAGTNPLDSGQADAVQLVPLLSGSIMLIRQDFSADDIQSNIYNGSSWAGWVTIDANAVESATYTNVINATVDKLSGDVYLTYVINAGTTSASLLTARYTSGAWTSKTAVLTVNSIIYASVAIDENTQDIYVAYVHGTGTSYSISYKKSTDEMTSWSTATQINTVTGDMRRVYLTHSSNERIYAAYYDNTLDDIFGNTVADLTPVTGINITGNAYSDEATTPTVWNQCNGSTANIAVSYNGGTPVTGFCNATTGAFSITIPAPTAPNHVIAVFMNPASAGDKGVVYTKNDDIVSNITGLKVTKNRAWIRSESTQTITNANINTYDQSNDSDIPAASTGTVLTLDSGTELHIETGDTFAPGGNVTAANLHAKGTYQGDAETLTLTGSGSGACTTEPGTIQPLCVDGGTFTPSTNTTVFSGTSATLIPARSYYHLSVTPAATVTHTISTGTLSVSGTLTIGNGTNATTVTAETNDPVVDLNSSIVVAAGSTFIASSTASFTVAGSITVNGTFTPGSGTVTLDTTGTADLTYASNTSFNNLTISTAGKMVRFDESQATTVSGTLTINGGACTNKVAMRSVTSGNQFDLNATGSTTITYADIKDSNALTALTASSSYNGGNNTNWTITQNACNQPETPTLDSPANGATGVRLSPVLKATGTSTNGGNLEYKFEIATDSSFTQNVQTYNQSLLANNAQTGWQGQNAMAKSAYTSGTQGQYVIMVDLAPNTTYYFRAYALSTSTGESSSAQDTPFSFTTGAAGSGYYVSKNDPDCNNTNSGAETAPWCTGVKMATTLTAGQSGYMKHGTYREEMIPSNSGTSGNVISYNEYPEHETYITGADLMSSWTLKSGNVYEASVAAMPNAVYQNGDLMTLESGANAVDAPGEYFASNTTITVYVTNIDSQGFNPTNTYRMEYTVRTNAVDIDGDDYTTWDGLSFGKTNAEAFYGHLQSTNTTVRNCTTEYGGINLANQDQGMTFIEESANTLIEYCVFRYNEWNGVSLAKGSDGTIRYSEAYENGHNGFDSKRSDVQNGVEQTTLFEFLVSHHNFDNGIYFQQTLDSIMQNCISYENDSDGFKADGATNTLMRNNISRDNGNAGLVAGINSTVVSTGTRMYNNVSYSNATYGIRFNDSETNIVKNNIIAENGSGAFYGTPTATAGATGTAQILDNNLYYDSDGGASLFIWNSNFHTTLASFQAMHSKDPDSKEGDPNFIRAASDTLANFRVQSGSPAIDAGETLTDVTNDYDEVSRPQGGLYDIGAYERVGIENQLRHGNWFSGGAERGFAL